MFAKDSFAGQTVVITGGGTGIGKAIALQLAGLGANIVIASRNQDHLQPVVETISRQGGQAIAVLMDVRKSEDVKRTLCETLDRFGAVHHIVNNAAGNFICEAEKLSDNGWRSVLGIVLDGTFYMSRTFGAHWIDNQQQGTITNIITTGAFTAGPGTVHNTSAKAGVLAMTRSLAVEWGKYGIRVNAIAPGPIDGTAAGERLWPTPEAKNRIVKSIPVGHLGEPDDVAHAVTYLISSYASYVSGECLVMDGARCLNNLYYEKG